MITLEGARDRVRICNGHIEPKQRTDGSWFCDNCGLNLRADKRNRSGFCHDYDPGDYKTCTDCKEEKHITDFYYRHGALDKRYSYCKVCARNQTANREKKLHLKGKSRTVWLPNDLWSAVEKVKGDLTFRDFLILSVRREVERRAKEMVIQKTLDNINRNKPK